MLERRDRVFFAIVFVLSVSIVGMFSGLFGKLIEIISKMIE